jgi:hypothetical protein
MGQASVTRGWAWAKERMEDLQVRWGRRSSVRGGCGGADRMPSLLLLLLTGTRFGEGGFGVRLKR